MGDFGTIVHFDGLAWSLVHLAGSSTVPEITSQRLHDVWASGPNDAWAVGAGGTILRRTSSGWGVHAQSGIVTQAQLTKVWGSGPTDVWAIGAHGPGAVTVLRFNGAAWSVVPGVSVTSTGSYTPMGLWGSGPSDVWIVADAIHHYNGSWTTTATPSSLKLHDVQGTTADDIWAVATESSRMLHYDGASWREVEGTATTGVMLHGIWPIAGGGVWGASDLGVYFHDGPSWRARAVNSSSNLLGVWGAAARDVWAVGSAIFHHDGSAWSTVPGSGTLATPGLAAVWGRTATDVWAVGSSGKILHYDGVWSAAPGSGTASTTTFFGVWASGPSDAWAVGSFEAIYHYNGTSWSAHPQSGMISSTAVKPFMYGVWGSGANDIWAGGAHGVYHYDGMAWTKQTSVSGPIRGLWGSGPDDVWAVGQLGRISHFDGTSWKEDPASRSLVNSNLNAVWGTSSRDVWAAGANGTLIHYDGTRWSTSAPATNGSLTSGWASAPDDVWAVGDQGTALHLGTALPSPYGGRCTAPISLYCGTPATPFVQYGAVSATSNQLDVEYACATRTQSGGETYYRLDVPVTGTVTVRLIPHDADLDLIQLGALADGCDATGACTASETAGSGAIETLTLDTVQGQTLYFVVDGPTAADATYVLQTSCTKE